MASSQHAPNTQSSGEDGQLARPFLFLNTHSLTFAKHVLLDLTKDITFYILINIMETVPHHRLRVIISFTVGEAFLSPSPYSFADHLQPCTIGTLNVKAGIGVDLSE